MSDEPFRRTLQHLAALGQLRRRGMEQSAEAEAVRAAAQTCRSALPEDERQRIDAISLTINLPLRERGPHER